jgi:hypothetical protein
MTADISMRGGEEYRARIKGDTLFYRVTFSKDSEHHYDADEHRLEVFILFPHGSGGGGRIPPSRTYQVKLPPACREVRFTEGYGAVYRRLEGDLINSFVSEHEELNTRRKSWKV